jgi:aminoglycoside phosphotransferase (APT) family kinase protein
VIRASWRESRGIALSQRPGRDAALQIAETLLGRFADRVEHFEPNVGGNDSHSFRLWLGADAMLLKIKKHRRSPVGVYFHRRLKDAGLPVPELIAFDPKGGPGGETCAIWEWIDGDPAEWGPCDPCPYDEAELGELLRHIHDLEFDGPFGYLGDDVSARSFTPYPDLGPVSESWADFFDFERAARRYFEKGYLDGREADVLSAVPDGFAAELGRAEPRLLHMGDIMHGGNLIVRDGRIAAIVDYVESMAGDPRWELAWFDYYFSELPFGRSLFDMARFQAAYGTGHDLNDPLRRFYLVAILVFEKLLFYDPGSRRGHWAIRALKDNLRAIGGRLR